MKRNERPFSTDCACMKRHESFRDARTKTRANRFRISTQVTPPSAKGVTWNQSATVSLNDGATRISMNDNGEASITNHGQSVSIAPGQTVQLGDGESVTYGENGSLRVTAQNGSGGRIESTLTARGKGVNVDVTAHDVDLGGALVNGYEQQAGPTPVHGRISGPVTPPISAPGPTPFRFHPHFHSRSTVEFSLSTNALPLHFL